MQLVLSNNRIVAHGENFFALGGVVINIETGAKYDNATIAECEGGCPSDINEVGYEYRDGVFVPCAPFGKGDNNGNVMEVCTSCATPRNSGIPIKDIKWSTIARKEIKISDLDVIDTLKTKTATFSVEDGLLNGYSMLRYVIKASSTYNLSAVSSNPENGRYNIPVIAVGNIVLNVATYTGTSTSYNTRITFDKDYICPCYLISSGNIVCDTRGSNSIQIIQEWTGNGITVDPLTLTITLPGKYSPSSTTYYSNADMIIDLEGRR